MQNRCFTLPNLQTPITLCSTAFAPKNETTCDMQNRCLIFKSQLFEKCLKPFTDKGFRQLLKYVENVKKWYNTGTGVPFAVSLTSKGLRRKMRQVKTDRSAVFTNFIVDPFCAMPTVRNRQLLAAATGGAIIATKTTIINPDHIEKSFYP